MIARRDATEVGEVTFILEHFLPVWEDLIIPSLGLYDTLLRRDVTTKLF